MFVDMTGQQVGDIFVEYRMPNRKNVAQWMCLCKCGRHFVTDGKSIRSGNTKSCGCRNSKVTAERNRKNLRDFTNQRVGKLVGLYSFIKDNRTYWHCICDCGRETDVPSYSMGRTQSCGCLKHEDLTIKNTKDITGQTFGELTAITKTDRIKNSSWVWICRCSCGNQVEATTHALCSGHKKSCGCIKSEPENIIVKFLENHHIEYQREKCLLGCRDKRLMPFDFYLPMYNMAIEYDGEFHYRQIPGFNDLPSQQHRDEIKTQYCEENDIILLRIPYWDKDNIESILKEWLFLDDE